MIPLSKLPLTPNLLLSINLHMSSLHSQSSQISLPYCKTFITVQFSSVQSLSQVRLFATPWTVAHQAPLSVGFSRQGYWSGLPCPPPGDLPRPGIASLASPAMAGGLFATSQLGSPVKIFIPRLLKIFFRKAFRPWSLVS